MYEITSSFFGQKALEIEGNPSPPKAVVYLYYFLTERKITMFSRKTARGGPYLDKSLGEWAVFSGKRLIGTNGEHFLTTAVRMFRIMSFKCCEPTGECYTV